jgi:GDP-L-fucose synthase
MRANPVEAVVLSAVAPDHRNAKNPEHIAYKNIRMFMNVACHADFFKKLIHLGSGSEYDMRHYQPKMNEDYFGEHVPEDEHGFAKFVCSRYVERSSNMVTLRLFGVFGKYEDYEIRFISNAICKLLRGKPITLKQNRRLDDLWIEDLAPGVSFFIENEVSHKAYNVTPDQSTELKVLADLVRKVSGRDHELIVSQPGLGVDYSGDNSRLKAEMPHFHSTPLDVSIRSLYAWYAAHPDVVREEALRVDK